MICAKDLNGRPVVDLDSAEKVGEVEEAILELDARRVAGLVVSQGPALMRGLRLFLPASTIHSIGPDAVTVHRPAEGADQVAYLASLPRPSQLVGRRMVTESGRFLGTLTDVLIDEGDGTLVGFAFAGPNSVGGLGGLFGRRRRQTRDYVDADSDFRVGHALIVVPDEAVVRGQVGDGESEHPADAPARTVQWADPGPRTRRLRPWSAPGPGEWERREARDVGAG